MGHLQDSTAQLLADFSDDWANALIAVPTADDPDDDEVFEAFTSVLAGRLDVAAGKLFEALNASVLSGEYVRSLSDYRQHLEDLETRVGKIAEDMDITGFPEMSLIGQDLIRTNFYYSVSRAIKSYLILIDFVERHLVYQANTSQLMHVMKREKEKPSESAAKRLDELFQRNIELAKIDHSISFRKSYFSDLVLMQHELKALTSSNTTAEILQKKCDFLLYKMSFRLKQSKENYLYSIDFVYSTIQPVPVPEFTSYNDVIIGHYDTGLPPHSFEVRNNAALYRLTSGADLNLDDYHALIKYFKDDKKDLPRLKSLRAKFKSFRDAEYPMAELYDRKALDIAYCYLENNILSLELDKKELALDNWKSKLKEYTDRAENFQNKNFFPYYKIVKEYLAATINDQFFEESDNFELIESLIKDYEDNLTKLGTNLGICEETDYLTFQSTYQGCMVDIKDSTSTTHRCFISSSFVLPLHYKEYREELETFKAKLSQFVSMLAIKKMIDKDRKSVKEVKDEIQKTDKRHIEILSIFAALVMFVSNEIQIFTKITNIANAAAYSFFFAFGLGVFVCMIWFITRFEGRSYKEFKTMHWFVMGFMIAGLLIASIFIFMFGAPSKDRKLLEHLQFQVDSVKKSDTLKMLKMNYRDTSKKHVLAWDTIKPRALKQTKPPEKK